MGLRASLLNEIFGGGAKFYNISMAYGERFRFWRRL